MSIFKETFKPFVRGQLETREKVISLGNKGVSHSRLTSETSEGLAPGAFYGYQQKQCVLRMSSLVDLVEDVGLDLGFTRRDGTRSTVPFSSYKGETFSRNFILQGGVLSDYAVNDRGRTNVREFEVRGGFMKPNKRINLSYGDPSVSADPSSDGYGVVPMPGITDANIRTKSAYGSLREAKVNFVCHNLRQLEILELLYMRPGYPVVLEWGWSPYIDNDGNIVNDFPSISYSDDFWDDNKVTENWCHANILKNKRLSDGNYDGFLGYVTQFNYEARADGGFNCTTELISMGECLDSLKDTTINNSFIDIEDLPPEDQERALYNSALGTIIHDLLVVTDENAGYAQDVSADGKLGFAEFFGLAFNGNWGFSVYKEGKKIDGAWAKLVEFLGDQAVAQGIIPKNSTLFDGTINNTKHRYIRWDLFAEMLNIFVTPRNEKGAPTIVISPDRYTYLGNDKFQVEPLLYCKYTDANQNFMDVSCDAGVCILPHQFADFSEDNLTQLGIFDRIGLGFTALASTSPLGLAIAGLNGVTTLERGGSYLDGLEFSFNATIELYESAFTGENRNVTTNFGRNLQLNQSYANRRIGNILLNIDMIDEVFKNTFKSKDATIGDFLKNIWDKVNNACPTHNFIVRTDFEKPNIVQVIDLPITSNDLNEIDYDKLFKFNVLSNDTVVRNFKYNTQIPSALKATIAINAQSGMTTNNIDAVTFAAFNEAIKSRLHSFSKKFSNNEAENYASDLVADREERRARLQGGQGIEFKDSLIGQIALYKKQFFNALEGDIVDENAAAIFSTIKSIIKEAQSIEAYLEKTDTGYLKNSSVIPLNLNLVLDGIGGMIIGNVFRIDESRLPKAYRNSRVAFVVLGEDQNITAGQDWTTNIRGQLIIFPEKNSSRGNPRPAVRYVEVTPNNRPASALDTMDQNDRIGPNGDTLITTGSNGEVTGFIELPRLTYQGDAEGNRGNTVAVNAMNRFIGAQQVTLDPELVAQFEQEQREAAAAAAAQAGGE